MNADTPLSLQIMQSESHPHSHNQGPTKSSSGSKEGLSVYGLFHHLARSPQGKYMLRQYFLRPSLSIPLINERLDAIGVFLKAENDTPFRNMVKAMSNIFNVRRLLINLRKGVSGSSGRNGGIANMIWSGVRKVGITHGDAFFTRRHSPWSSPEVRTI